MIPSKPESGENPLIELKPGIIPPFMPHLARPMAKHMRRLGRANTSCRRNPCLVGLILPARILASGAVSILAAVTTPFASVVRVTGAATPKMVVQPRAGTGPKDAAKRCAMKVNRLFATVGAGEVLPLNSACCWAMKMPDAAYDLQ